MGADKRTEHLRSVAAGCDHLERLAAKRDRLIAAMHDAVDQLALSIERYNPTPSEAVDLWQMARQLGLPFAAQRVATATGYRRGQIAGWVQTGCLPSTPGISYAGDFPLEHQMTPQKGTPTVYVLFNADGRAVYIGRSEHVRARLRAHWVDSSKPGLARWFVVVCADADEMYQRETDLIYEHQPNLNIVGKRPRR